MKFKKKQWAIEELVAFGIEISAIGNEAKIKLGEEDVKYIKKIKNWSRISEVFGRAFIHFSVEPITWSLGTLLLGLHHQLETAEIGHSALHGAWDGLKGAETLDSKNFRWATPIDEESWKYEHNILHHRYTNIVGKDPDLNYGPLRVTEQTRWRARHLIQVSQFFYTAPFFIWMIAGHAAGLTDITHPKDDTSYAAVLPNRQLRTFANALWIACKKMIPFSLYEFAFWPALAGPLWWKVLGGNITADILRNLYTGATIYAGHFGDDLQYFDKEFRAPGRGAWYKAQIESAHDYVVPKFMSLLCGGLDLQIEHHLFPKLPPNRLREIAPKIEEICRRYQVNYIKTSWGKNLAAAVKRLAKMSLPKKATISRNSLRVHSRRLPSWFPSLRLPSQLYFRSQPPKKIALLRN